MKRLLQGIILPGVVTVSLYMLSPTSVEAMIAEANRKLSQSQINTTPGALPRWSVVKSPNGNGSDGLGGIAVVSARDIWAVGTVENQTTHARTTLIESWNGAQWQIVPRPNPGSLDNVLSGISAVSATDIWAVGTAANATGAATQTLIEHWNGVRWSIMPSPSPGSENNVLFSVAAVSATHVWAVGSADNSTLIEHFHC